jgi:hypothetical protein
MFVLKRDLCNTQRYNNQYKLVVLCLWWVKPFSPELIIQGVPEKTKTIEITNNNLIVRIWMP